MDVTGKIVMLPGGNHKCADTNDVKVGTGLYEMTNAVSNGAAAVIHSQSPTGTKVPPNSGNHSIR